jgi:hypothetical protein
VALAAALAEDAAWGPDGIERNPGDHWMGWYGEPILPGRPARTHDQAIAMAPSCGRPQQQHQPVAAGSTSGVQPSFALGTASNDPYQSSGGSNRYVARSR